MADEIIELKGSYVDHTIRRVYPGQCKVCGRTRCRGHKLRINTQQEVGRSYRLSFADDPYEEKFPSEQPHLAAQYAHRLANREANQDVGVPEQLSRSLRTQKQRESAKVYKKEKKNG